ncbi:hypothetical protein F5884DRAFT_858681 [Xylogone sp. PMI_703]|nr:hypothetical protein F5884DRAFT_858681 [Xylogone sp. PMI_703]
MPLYDRAASRNVHFHNSSTGEVLGGFYQAGSITEENLLWIFANILLITDADYTVYHRESARVIQSSSNPVEPGNYDIRSTGTIALTEEPWVVPPINHGVSEQEDSFCKGDNYKITTFFPNARKIDGKVLHPVYRKPDDPNRVSDHVLRWHFRQSILANMRRAGEPTFEADFPPGYDMMATLREEPYGKERLEMELAWRLRHVSV